MDLNFNNELDNIFSIIGESKIMSLATSSKNRPTVRLISCIVYNRKILFQTGNDLLKFEQMCDNNNVGLCFNNIQMEGVSKIIGKTNDKQNNKIMEIFRKHFQKSYETYSHYDKEVLIEISLTKIIKWDYENEKPFRIFLDINNKTIKKEMYL